MALISHDRIQVSKGEGYWIKRCQCSSQWYCNPQEEWHYSVLEFRPHLGSACCLCNVLYLFILLIKWHCGIGLIFSLHSGACLSHERKPIRRLLWSIYLMLGCHRSSAVRFLSRAHSTIEIFSHWRKACWKEHKSKTCTQVFQKTRLRPVLFILIWQCTVIGCIKGGDTQKCLQHTNEFAKDLFP